jgi:hypothetical protein
MNWSEDLQQGILDCAEEIVCCTFHFCVGRTEKNMTISVPRTVRSDGQVWSKALSQEE